MRHLVYIIFICCLLNLGTTMEGAAQVAFPGAEGYGRVATGGRGTSVSGNKMFLDAQVVAVTNLNDDGEGSFRWALEQQDTLYNGTTLKIPTTIVFRVGGVINLQSDIHVETKNLTIAGQTAPGDGICFRGATLNLSGSSNIIVRYIRSRPGDELGEETSAFRIENGSNFIIDHCSFSWAIEETTHFSSSEDLTVQWCIVSESLYNSIHKKGARGYATQWGGQYASYHHNLLAHHNSRMPRINGSNENDVYALVDYRNNVNYNWSSEGAFYGGEWEGTDGKGFCHTNVVNNYFIPGPSLSGDTIFAKPSLNRDDVELDGYGKWYFDGNIMKGNQEMTESNWLGVDVSNVGSAANIRSDTVFVESDGEDEAYDEYTESAEDAYASVLADAGATLPERDAHDTRLISEITGETEIVRYKDTIARVSDDGDTTLIYSPTKGVESGIIDTQDNLVSPEDRAKGVTAWDVYDSASTSEAPTDTDNDGMPDEWETANGLDPNDGDDFREITPSGYNYLEIYLNELVGDTIDANDSTNAVIELVDQPEVNVFPNPCENQFFVYSDYPISSIELYDLSGRKVQIVSGKEEENCTVQVDQLQDGYYLIKLTTTDGRMAKAKILKR